MDGKGGCCIARCVGGAYDYDMSKLDRIMLKFRPIAPKPIASTSGVSTVEMTEQAGKNTKGKRKYVRESLNGNKKRCKSRRRGSPEEMVEPVVTLPLLPETPELKDSPARGSPANYNKDDMNLPMWLSFNNHSQAVHVYRSSVVGSVVPMVVMIPQSCITMECVTDTWIDGKELGFTDEERMRTLDSDTCPGFISDGKGRVTWTNAAYREMVGQREVDGSVWLIMKESFPMEDGMEPSPALTCRVRVQYTCGKEWNSVILPCDVWRMDDCCFAWRLDVKAALCLGR